MADPHASGYILKDLLTLHDSLSPDLGLLSPDLSFFSNDPFGEDMPYTDVIHKDEFSQEGSKYERHMENAEKSEKKVLRDQKRIADIDVKIGKLKERCENLNLQKDRLEFEIMMEKEAVTKHKRDAELAQRLAILRNKFPFEQLPPEIRNTILEQALVEPDTIRIEVMLPSWRPNIPAVLVHSPRMREEAGSIYFGKNKFYFVDSESLWGFLRYLDNATVRHIRHITIRWDHPRSHFAAKQLKRCTNLQTLRFEFTKAFKNIFGVRLRKNSCITTTQGLKSLVNFGRKYKVVEVFWNESDNWTDEERTHLQTIKSHLEGHLMLK